jgi:hypothetical protein
MIINITVTYKFNNYEKEKPTLNNNLHHIT